MRTSWIEWIEKEIEQCVQQWVLMQISTPSELFSWIFCRKLSEHRFFQELSTLPKTFHPVVQTIKVNKVSWRPLDCPAKQFRAFWGRVCRRQVVWARYSLDVEQLFWIFLPFAIIYCGSHHLESCRKCVPPHNSQHLLSVHVILGLREKSINPVFWQKLSGKLGFLGKYFVSRFLFLYLAPQLPTFGTLLLWSSIWQTVAGFWGDKIFFFSQFLFEVRIVNLNPRCYLYWLFSASSLRTLLHALWHCISMWAAM